MKTKVAIQGGMGAFHEIAARKYFTSDIDIIPCETFSEVLELVQGLIVDNGIMAIENTVAGSILPNYKLLRESKLHIAGEINIAIQQNLAVLQGQTIDKIIDVYSHPMALLQCDVFFKQHLHIKLVESIDTALSAKDISEKQLFHSGAICSELAAEMYKLEIIARNIETNKRNFTRFLIVSKEKVSGSEEIDKSSLCFSLPHESGSLSKVLSILAYYQLNLTKIQSLPILGREWEYLFYVDITFKDYIKFIQGLDAIKPLINHLEIMGEYKSNLLKETENEIELTQI